MIVMVVTKRHRAFCIIVILYQSMSTFSLTANVIRLCNWLKFSIRKETFPQGSIENILFKML